ncbi:MAG: branched-chain amino acid transaminase [Alphaproteobacteria bacterium]|nr:branched-chain amino acid transaminase [Alphaproteobacteria bacterium]
MLDKLDGWIWLDGKMVEWKKSTVHTLTQTIHYGSGIFEGERLYNGKIFKEKEHNDRLFYSADLIGMNLPYSKEELLEARRQVVADNNLQDAYIRPHAWYGPDGMSISSENHSVHVAIAGWKWTNYYDENSPGLRLNIARWKRPASDCSPSSGKIVGNYVIATMAVNEAKSKGFDDSLMLDYRGLVAEATVSNLFFVKNGEIITPIADCFLDGITRQTVLEIATKLNIKCTEKKVLPAELFDADEVFVCGTAIEIQPVISIEENTFEKGPITRQIKNEYEKITNS